MNANDRCPNMARIVKPLLKLIKPQKPISKPIKINTITANGFNNVHSLKL